MTEKTLVASAPDGEHFAYREDYLLFGMLVRHGLCKPSDYTTLVAAQSQQPGRPTLLVLLADANKLPEKARKDMQDLLDVLAEPKLRKLLPSELPPVETVLAKTLADPEATEVAGAEADAPTIGGGPVSVGSTQRTTGITRLSATLSATHLTQDELTRLESAKKKSALVGGVLAGHIVLDKIGGGGQGDVYLAKQVSLNRYVALKKLEVPVPALAQRFIEGFRAEAQTLAALNHASIVKVFDIFEEGDGAYFTMEHINGRTIRELVKDGGAMPVEVVANLACQACNALALTAEQGLVHRDIKPANMMLDQNGDLKIVDFGLASASASLIVGEKRFSGTPAYASPEQAALQDLGPASDQYALGLTLYYALTGEQTFSGTTVTDLLFKQMNEAPVAPSKRNESLPAAIDRVLLKMLAKKPEDRYKDFDACYEAWADVLRSAGPAKSTVATKQLMGASLLRLGRAEAAGLWKQGIALAMLWFVFAIGAGFADLRLSRTDWGLVLMDACGDWGTWLLVFSLSCIAYVAAVRRQWLRPVLNVRAVLITHISTAVPAVAMLLLHSGHFVRGLLTGGPASSPLLTALLGVAMLATAVSGTAGLVIFRSLRRQLQLQELNLRGAKLDPAEAMRLALGAELLSGWRLVHYPLAVFMVALSILHIYVSLRLSGN
ncbi:MAG: serine/threonine-protein kinase [Candidatus Sumerlaeia bacterium]|nr:serine/threonine-protein kinase [Candidatus Sumerlaeia bacterium]